MQGTIATSKPTRAGSGFTLIELMVVMLIISLLASILVPAVNQARTAAKVAQSKALVFNLESALHMFKSDEMLGNEFPPSRWLPSDFVTADDDPYSSGKSYTAYGAQTLVWAVVGAGLTGTHPFEEGRLQELYDPAENHLARGPFMDASKLAVHKVEDAECELADKLSSVTTNSPAPVILDSFGMPVLYWRPDRSTGPGDPIHDRLPQENNEAFAGSSSLPLANNSEIYDPNKFDDFFMDERANDMMPGNPPNRPHNYDSFVLLSAGADRIYGTADDVANFELND